MINLSKEAIRKIPPIFRNVFFLAGVLFSVWMLFLDDNNMLSQYRLWSELRDMESKMKYYKAEAIKVENEYNKLMNNERYAMQYAREKYWMKKDNEDLYIVVEK
jgi:cell division protein DivIC